MMILMPSFNLSTHLNHVLYAFSWSVPSLTVIVSSVILWCCLFSLPGMVDGWAETNSSTAGWMNCTTESSGGCQIGIPRSI